jgi:hypothetical protein
VINADEILNQVLSAQKLHKHVATYFHSKNDEDEEETGRANKR